MRHKYLLLVAMALSGAGEARSESSPEFSGFLRAVGGYLDAKDASYYGYGDSVSFDNNSLIGLQGKVAIDSQLSATGLVIAHTNDTEDSGIEWLYLSYAPDERWDIKLGQMQTPFYSLSDVLDVGYAYPWVVAPREVYNDYIFERFQGIDLRYSIAASRYTAYLEAYYGRFDDEIVVNTTKVDTDVDGLMGLTAMVRIESLQLRAAAHRGNVMIEIPEIEEFASILRSAGFDSAADTLDITGQADFFQLGLDYDLLDYFVKAEWSRINAQSDYFPSATSYYLSVGHVIGPATLFATYASRADELKEFDSGIPVGLDPQLDQLAFGYQQAIQFRTEDDVESWGLGLRWDLQPGIALKAEYKFVDVEPNNQTTFLVEPAADFDNDAAIILFGLDWIF